MHVIALRRDVYERDRWIARSLYKAFEEAKRLTYEGLIVSAAAKTMLPWQIAQVEQVRREMGEDWWPYGVAPNRHVLETFLRYHHEQGLSPRRVAVDELFAPECRDAFKI
jgi:4,5-dihydroxyphthalate decarboxylase